ncbi:MAG: CotH kinase family protein [Muribaculaceae bacterium]|nr:CotH kinase family protein [Muribaculaceae bacterium]
MLLVGIMAAWPTMMVHADTMDDEGYPVLYVLGTDNRWSPRDDHRFTRSGNEYSITLNSLDGEFKIGSDQWHYNLGGDATITKPVNLKLISNGPNLRAANLKNVSIKFTLSSKDAPMANTIVRFGINGEWDETVIDPDDPVVNGLSGTLPVIYINVYKVDADGNYVLDGAGNKILDDEVIDINLPHKNYFTAEYWLDVNGCEWLEALGAKSVGSADEPLPTQIKARGNYTRIAYAKKPFKLKLGKKQNLLGLTPDKSKHYALLAHADDTYGFLRNFTSFNLGKRIGLPAVCGMQPIEVVINGNYRGLYFLTESIRVDDGRINITELDDNVTDSKLISGGYLVELDNYDEENQIRMNEKSCAHGQYLDMLRITWDTPEEYSELQRRFITDQFTAMNDHIGANSDDTWRYIDLDDAVRYYIAREITSDVEAYHGSTYMYRDYGDNQKWHFSPIWDAGNAFNGSTHDFFYNCDPYGNTWIPSMRENAKFNEKLTDTWQWFMSCCYDGIVEDMKTFVEHIKPAVKADYERWKDSPTPHGGMRPADNRDMDSRLRAAVDHLNAKTSWLRQQWGDYGLVCLEPERDDTPAAPLPDYAATGVENVAVDNGVDAVYYDIYGRRVANPAHGQLVIRCQGSQSTKVVF